jgi:putative transposase
MRASHAAQGERGIWQRRYWEHTLRDQDDFARHLDLHPFQSGQARSHDPSAGLAVFLVRRWVRFGAYSVDWAGDPGDGSRPFGEK